MEILKGRQLVSWLGVLYSVPGIGKSTLAAQAPMPLFLDLEGGLSRIDCDKTHRISTWDELISALRFAYESEYKTIVLDTIDGLEEIIRKHVCESGGQKSIEGFGYGKGYQIMVEKFQELLVICDKIKAKNKNIFFIGHEQIKSFTAPDQDTYDRYIPKMNAKLASILISRVDFVFFAQYETHLKADKINDERLRAVGTGRRIMRTQESPAWIAKNRFSLEPSVAMDKSIFDKLI